MTQDEIIEMAIQAGMAKEIAAFNIPIIEIFAKLVAAKAIAKLESQKPVALPCCGYTDASAVKWNPLNGVVQCHNCGQNYTTPQRTWAGLTNNELQPIADEYRILFGSWVEDFARAIEAKLKQKNT